MLIQQKCGPAIIGLDPSPYQDHDDGLGRCNETLNGWNCGPGDPFVNHVGHFNSIQKSIENSTPKTGQFAGCGYDVEIVTYTKVSNSDHSDQTHSYWLPLGVIPAIHSLCGWQMLKGTTAFYRISSGHQPLQSKILHLIRWWSHLVQWCSHWNTSITKARFSHRFRNFPKIFP